jgi:hypothetical protein
MALVFLAYYRQRIYPYSRNFNILTGIMNAKR